MASNSDIIQIGFDYKDSLEKFLNDYGGTMNQVQKSADGKRIEIKFDVSDKDVINKISSLQGEFKDVRIELNGKALSQQLQSVDDIKTTLISVVNLINKGADLSSLFDFEVIASKATKAADTIKNDFSSSADSIKSDFERLKTEIAEVENAYNKIKRNKLEEQESRYVDRYSGDYVDLSGYDSVSQTKENFEYLESKLKEIYTLYNNVKSAIDNNNGWFNGYQYDSSDLNQMIFDFKSLAQAYYELDPSQMNKSMKEIADSFGLPVEKVKTLKQVIARMSDEFKGFVVDVIADSDSVKANNKAFNEETQQLIRENEQAVSTYVKLKDQLLSKIADEDTRNKISDYIPYINTDFPDFSYMPNFGDMGFGDKINVLTEMCKILGIEIPQAAEESKEAINNINNAISPASQDYSQSTNQEKLQSELKETEIQAEQTAKSIENVNSQEPKKDAFHENATPVDLNANSSSTAIKEESDALEETAKNAKSAADAKTEFANANKKVEQSAESSASVIKNESDALKNIENIAPKTERFDEIIQKLGIAKDRAEQIEKIVENTQYSKADKKSYTSYDITYKNGYKETRGENSQTDRGNVLKSSGVEYDAKAEAAAKKEQLELDKKINDEINEQTAAQQKKWQSFLQEQQDYENSINQINTALSRTDDLLAGLPVPKELEQVYSKLIDDVEVYNEKLKTGKIKEPEYNKNVNSLFSDYSKKVGIQQNRDYEQHQAEAAAAAKSAKEISDAFDEATKFNQQFDNALNDTENKLQKISIPEGFNGAFTELQDKVSALNKDLANCKISISEYNSGISSAIKNYNGLIDDRGKNVWKELISDLQRYSQLQQRIANGKAYSTDAADAQTLLDRIYELQRSDVLPSDKLKESNEKLRQIEQTVEDITKSIKMNTLDNVQDTIDKYRTFADNKNNKPADQDQSAKYKQALADLNKAIKALEDYKVTLSGVDKITEENEGKIKELTGTIEKYANTVKSMSAAEKGSNEQSRMKEADKITKYLQQNTRLSKEAKKQLESYVNLLRSSDADVDVGKIHTEWLKVTDAERAAGREGKSFFDVVKEKAWYGAASAIGTYFGVNDFIRYGQQVASIVTDINSKIVDLAKVSEATSSQIYKDFNSYAEIAKDIGGTISDTIEATTAWAKNGYSIPDAKELARVSQLYKNIGDNIDIASANESLISTLKGFQLEADQAEHIIDVFNEVSNNEPISSSGIGTALQRSAASFNAANTSLEKSVALVTATNTVLQDEEKVGNMWKTVSARLRGADTELKAMGEDTEGMAESTSKLRDLIKGMTGFDIMKDKDTFKDIYDIIVGIGEQWDKLSDTNRAALLEKLAGKNQSNALAAALSNIDILKKSYDEAMNSDGSAMREQEKYQESIQYSIDQTKAKLEELANDALSSDFLKGLIDGGGKLIDILDILVDKLGIVKTAALGISAALSLNNVGELKLY